MRLSPHTAQHLWSFSMDFHEASVPISPAPQCLPRGQLARSLGTFAPVFPKARGLRLGYASPCGRLSRPRTTTPHPSLPKVIGVSSRLSPFYCPLSFPFLGKLPVFTTKDSNGMLEVACC